MESNELLQSLAKLETSLNDVESAKKQVQQTVDAYSALQKQIAEYTNSLDSIKSGVQGIISDLNARKASLGDEARSITASLESKCNQLLETLTSKLATANELFSKEGKAISDSFKKNTDEELTKLQQNVQELKECTTSLESLNESIKETLSQISQLKQGIAELKHSLETSQNAQDTLLSSLQSSVNSLSDKQEQALSGLMASIDSMRDTQKEAFDKVDAQFKTNDKKMEDFSAVLAKKQGTNIVFSIIIIVLLFVLAALVFLK